MSRKYENTTQPAVSERNVPAAGNQQGRGTHRDIYFLVPMQQGIVSGIIGGLLVLIGCLWLEAPFRPREWVLIFATPAVFICGLVWYLSIRWADQRMWKREEQDQADHDGDGHIGPPPRLMSKNRSSDAARALAAAAKERERLEEFVIVATSPLRGRRKSEDSPTGIRNLRKHGFDDKEIVRFRDHLTREDIGLARWKGQGPTAGWEMIASQAEALRVIRDNVEFLPG